MNHQSCPVCVYVCVCVLGALELEGVEVKVQLGEGKSIEDLLPKQVNNFINKM